MVKKIKLSTMHEKGLLVAPKIDKQSCKAMIRVS
jgi:hypothetical protein